jgi:hypothetical protein
MKTATPYRPTTAILIGGGIAATLDIIYAIVRNGMSGTSPLWVLQSVASGWLGKGAFESGVAGGMLGLASHYAILFVAAAIYLAAAKVVSSKELGVSQSKTQGLAVMPNRPLISGAIFGVLVYLFMNFVVMPLSAVPFHINYTVSKILEGFVFHAVLVGMPIAWAVGGLKRDS